MRCLYLYKGNGSRPAPGPSRRRGPPGRGPPGRGFPGTGARGRDRRNTGPIEALLFHLADRNQRIVVQFCVHHRLAYGFQPAGVGQLTNFFQSHVCFLLLSRSNRCSMMSAAARSSRSRQASLSNLITCNEHPWQLCRPPHTRKFRIMLSGCRPPRWSSFRGS